MTENREYIDTITCPECITNVLLLADERLKQIDQDKHQNVMFEYDLVYGSPSGKYMNIIDKCLERRGINWRMHSSHTNVPNLRARVILRKLSIIDLTREDTMVEPYTMEIERVMLAYSKQYGQPLIRTPSHMTVFRQGDAHNKYYWVYTRVFDMWVYDDLHPELGWKEVLVDEEIEDPLLITKALKAPESQDEVPEVNPYADKT